jgi:formylglycine-generating enzyme required for sulfatase activity
VMRGGHWRSGATMLRSAMRTRVYPNYRRPTIGFRLAAELDQ